MIAKGNTLVVDVRDGTEVAATGKVAGAIHVSSAASWSSRPIRNHPTGDKNFDKDKNHHRLLRLGRTRGAERQDAQGSGLREGLQPRRLQGLGRQRRHDRQVGFRFSCRRSAAPRPRGRPRASSCAWPVWIWAGSQAVDRLGRRHLRRIFGGNERRSVCCGASAAASGDAGRPRVGAASGSASAPSAAAACRPHAAVVGFALAPLLAALRHAGREQLSRARVDQ